MNYPEEHNNQTFDSQENQNNQSDEKLRIPEDVSMKELVKCIAISLVDQVSRIQIAEIQGNQTHIIELKVAKEDIGKVIGRQGRTADAIRTILNCAAAKLSKRYILQIIDEGRNHRNHKPHDRV